VRSNDIEVLVLKTKNLKKLGREKEAYECYEKVVQLDSEKYDLDGFSKL
jgi:hypothetical protein